MKRNLGGFQQRDTHVHFHLIPRYNGDRITLKFHPEPVPAEELEAVMNDILKGLS